MPEVRAAAAPWQHVRTIGEDVSATELLLPEGHRLRPVDLAAAAAAGHIALAVRRAPHVVVIPTGDEVRPLGAEPGAGRARRHELADARRAGARGGLRRSSRSPSLPDDPARIAAARRARRAARADLVIVIAGSSAGPRRLHRGGRRGRPGRCSCTASRSSPGHPVVLGAVGGTRGARRAGLSGLRRADVRASSRSRCSPRSRARRRSSGRARAPGSRAGWPPRSAPTTGSASGSAASAAGSSRRRCRAAPACSPRSCAPTGCCVVPAALEGHDAGDGGRGAAAARPRRGRAHDRRDRLARPGARPRRLAAARARPAADARQRPGRLAQRAGRAARRPLPLRRLPPARPRHAASTRCRGSSACCPGGRSRWSGSSHREQGLIVAAGNPLGVDGLDDLPRVRYVNRQRGAGTRVLLDHELGQAGHRPGGRSTATSARSRPTSRSPPRSPRAGRTPAWA